MIRGRARTGGLLGVIIAVAVTACGGGNGGEAESADDVVSCFEDAELTEVAGERDVGLRDDKLLIYSAEIGPEDRTAIEECFIAEE